MQNKRTLFIIPNNESENLIKDKTENNSLIQYKIMSLEEFVKHYYFDYDKKAIFYTKEKYNLKIETVIEYLNNLIFLKQSKYQNNKLNLLVEIKEYLELKKLLIYDPLFKELIKTYDIEVMYENLDSFYLEMFKEIDNVTFKENKESFNKELTAIEFSNIDDEVAFIGTSIIELINKNIDINSIKITNVTEEYIYPLKRIFKQFNLSLNLKTKTSIYETVIGLDFIKQVKENTPIINIIENLKNNYKSTIINIIIDICNTYSWYKGDTIKLLDLLIYDLKNTKVKKEAYSNTIEEIDLSNITEDNYVFIMGFNNENIPKTYRDDSIINDKLKDILKLNNTDKLNEISRSKTYNNLLKTENVVITYKLKTPFKTYYKSTLIEELNMKVIKQDEINYDKTYSNSYNKYKLKQKIDNYIKYNKIDNNLELLYSNYYNKTKFLSYDHRYSGIDSNKLKDVLKDKLTMSYTTMDNYYRCSFRYYLSSILKLDLFESTFKTEIGKIFHYLLSIKDRNCFNLEEEYKKEINKRDFTIKEKFYLEKLEKEFPYIITEINEQNKQSTLNSYLYEEKFLIDIENTFKTEFKGFVDKVCYKEENDTLISIIDYKTGSIHSNIANSIYGIGMQLPVYLYLVKKSNRFNKPKVVGFYLQKIIHEEFPITKNKTYNDLRKEDLKLVGYSTSNFNDLSKFDKTYENSEIIKSMKVTKDEKFSAYSKVITEEQMIQLEDLVETKIKEAATNILNANFDINPKKIGDKNEGCEFCKFKDICYMTNDDLVYLKEYKALDFLGGDNNA